MAAQKLTEELAHELEESPTIEAYLSRNAQQLDVPTLAAYLEEKLDEHGLIQSHVVNEAQLNATYGYQIFRGQRSPSRDKLLQILMAMHLNLKEVNTALKLAGHAELYVKKRRDAIIYFAIERSWSLLECEQALLDAGETSLIQLN